MADQAPARHVFWALGIGEYLSEAETGVQGWEAVDYVEDEGETLSEFLKKWDAKVDSEEDDQPPSTGIGRIYRTVLKEGEFLVVRYNDYRFPEQFITTEPDQCKAHLESVNYYNAYCQGYCRDSPACYSAIIDWNSEVVWRPTEYPPPLSDPPDPPEFVPLPEEFEWTRCAEVVEFGALDLDFPDEMEIDSEAEIQRAANVAGWHAPINVVNGCEAGPPEREIVHRFAPLHRPGTGYHISLPCHPLWTKFVHAWDVPSSRYGSEGSYTLTVIAYEREGFEMFKCTLEFQGRNRDLPRLASLTASASRNAGYFPHATKQFTGDAELEICSLTHHHGQITIGVFMGL